MSTSTEIGALSLSLKRLIFFASFIALMLIENIILRTSLKSLFEINNTCINNDYRLCTIFHNIDVWTFGIYVIPIVLMIMTVSLILYMRLYVKNIKYLIISFPVIFIANIEIQKYIGII
jgi:hypothetical protein